MKDEIVLRLNYQRLTYSEGILQIVLQDSFTAIAVCGGHTSTVGVLLVKGVVTVERKKERRVRVAFLAFHMYFPRFELKSSSA